MPLKFTNLSVLRADDFRITTWIAIGALITSLTTLCLPPRLTISIPLFVLLSRLLHTYLQVRGILTKPSNKLSGRWTARVPRDYDSMAGSEDNGGVVIFILGARTQQ